MSGDQTIIESLATEIVAEVDGVAPSNLKRVKALGRIKIKAQGILSEVKTPTPVPPPVVEPPPIIVGPPPPVPPPPTAVIRVTAGQSLQAAIDNSPPGATLALENGATYVGEFTLTDARCIRAVKLPPSGRVATSYVGPILRSSVGDTLTIRGAGVVVAGIQVSSDNPDAQLIVDEGQRTKLSDVLVLGDSIRGQHRGILAHGQGGIYAGCFVDRCFLPGRDAQAIAGWDGTKNLLIEDCYLGGGAQSLMFGGADSSSSANIPQDITVTRSTLSKNPTWVTNGAQIKTALELKAVQRFRMEDCDLEYAGISDGQGGYLIVLTPRNQDGNAPWSEVRDVTITNCRGRYAAGIMNLLGRDSDNPSGPLSTVTLSKSMFTDIDPQRYPGDGRMFLIGEGPEALTLSELSVQGQNLASSLYFYGKAPKQMVVRNVLVPKSDYGIFVDGQGSGEAAAKAYSPDLTLDAFTELP